MPPRTPLFLAAFLALAAAAAGQDPLLAGKVEGGTYVSATGEFRIPVPVLPELGGHISDTENVVTFTDDFDTHVSIACFPMDALQKWERDTRGLRDYLLYFFTEFVLADFQRRFPKSTIESARYLPELLNGTLVTYALLPGGSFFEGRNRVLGAPPPDPVVAKRGTLLFVRDGHFYVISSELAERATQRSTYHGTVEEENQILTERLTALAGRLVFTSPKPQNP
jgi:hypothetical protein